MKNIGKNLKSKKRNISVDEKETFCEIIKLLEDILKRNEDLFDKYKIDLIDYDESFYVIVETLFVLHYGDWKTDIIFWYILERKDKNGELFPIEWYNEPTDETTEIFINTPEELWDTLHKLENKN